MEHGNLFTKIKIVTISVHFLKHFPKLLSSIFVFRTKNKKNKKKIKKKERITQGIKLSWMHKRSLYAFNKNSNEPKANGIKYCRILRKLRS
jgi:hypothetical protein